MSVESGAGGSCSVSSLEFALTSSSTDRVVRCVVSESLALEEGSESAWGVGGRLMVKGTAGRAGQSHDPSGNLQSAGL